MSSSMLSSNPILNGSSPRASSETPPSIPPPVSLAAPFFTSPPLEQLRLHQLYTLALADRMRFLQQPVVAPISPGTIRLTGDFSHPVYPYPGVPSNPTKFDPRMFRLPEEPKPQQSYIGLISMAILSSQEHKLVLADIYQYILDNYAYFRHRGPGWRNSIRHNLSLNDCFIKAGRAANGKGHYWAIHPACKDDFQRGDYRRRKAQRKVRRHMGLAVDEEDSPSPPPPNSPPNFHHWTGPLTLTTPGIAQRGLQPPSLSTQNCLPTKRQFDVAFLLGRDDRIHLKEDQEVSKEEGDQEEEESQEDKSKVVKKEQNDDEEEDEEKRNGEIDHWSSPSGLPNPQSLGNEYLARYYQLMQSAAAAAALADPAGQYPKIDNSDSISE